MIKKAGIGFMSGLIFALFAYSSAFAGPTEIKLKKGNAYVSINAGLTIVNDIDFGSELSYAGITANATGTASFDPGGGSVGVAIGYIVSDRFRTELELGYTKMDHDQVEGSVTLTAGGSTFTVSGEADVDGSVEAAYGLANFILTPFGSVKDEFLGTSFTPLVGVGFGLTSWEDDIYMISSGEGTTLLVDGEESDTDFLSAVMLGLEYDASESVSWTVKYRHFWANSGKNGVEDSEGENLVANVRISF